MCVQSCLSLPVRGREALTRRADAAAWASRCGSGTDRPDFGNRQPPTDMQLLIREEVLLLIYVREKYRFS